MSTTSPTKARLLTPPEFSDARVAIRVLAGVVSIRDREAGCSECRAREIRIENRSNEPIEAILRFTASTRECVVAPGETTSMFADYYFDSPHGYLELKRRLGFVYVYDTRNAPSTITFMVGAKGRWAGVRPLYRFTFSIDHFVGDVRSMAF